MSPPTRIWVLTTLAIGLFGLVAGVLLQFFHVPGQALAILAPKPAPGSPEPRRSVRAHELGGEVSKSVFEGKRVLVALTAGQSNAANHGEGRLEYASGVYAYYLGKFFHARDPLPGAPGDGGSVWSRLGEQLVRSGRYDAVLFACVAEDRSELRRWAPGGDLYPRMVYTLRDLKANGVPATHLLWHQGETDANLRTDPADYRRLFRSLVKGLRAEGFDGRVYASVATRRGTVDDPDLHRVGQSLAGLEPGVFVGPDTDVLGLEFRDGEGVHFNARGLERCAELWTQRLAAD